MKSFTTLKFRLCYASLPSHIQDLARKNYRLWLENKDHPSIQFKQVHPTKPIFSARVGMAYRALGVTQANEIIWFWIGSHNDYDKLLSQL